MIKWSYIELVWTFSSVFKHVFQNNLAHLYSLKSRSAVLNMYIMFTPPPPPPKKKKKKKKIYFLYLDSLPICKKKIINTESSWQIIQMRKKNGQGVGEVCVVWARGGWGGGGGGIFFFFFFFGQRIYFFRGGYFSIN